MRIFKPGMIGWLALLLPFFISCNGSTSTANGSSSDADNTTTQPGGKKIYQQTCITCHNDDGMGVPGMYPPLAKSDFLLANKFRAIHQILKGSTIPITVNGNSYTGLMPPQPLNDVQTAQVLNYVYHSWGNNGFSVTAIEVKSVRDTLK